MSRFLFKSNFFSFREFFHTKIFPFNSRFLFFSSQEFFSCRDLSVQVDIFQFKARVEMFVWIPCWYFPP